MTALPLLADVRDAAVQGSWCPKLCTHSCPVTMATGDQHAVPWSFHRVVSDLADGRALPEDIGGRLDLCSGCLACQGACAYDQDVPAQVVAGRAVAPINTPAADAALAHMRAGRRPDGEVAAVGREGSGVVLFAGCQDAPEDVSAAVALLDAAGLDPRVVAAPGCCGGVARDLGHTDLAGSLAVASSTALAGVREVVVLDPHCELEDVTTTSVIAILVEHVDELVFIGAPVHVTVHDPCLSARRDGEVTPARVLLAAAGVTPTDPEGSGSNTVCSGGGLSLPLVDLNAADAVARRRVVMLGPGQVVTWCGRAQTRLAGQGANATSLLRLLHDRLATP